MTRLRFTLAQLMAVVIFLGFGFAALRSASVLWSTAVFTVTVAVLSAAILGAMARRGRARMTWAGFALFGWVYLGTTFGPWAAGNGVAARALGCVVLCDPRAEYPDVDPLSPVMLEASADGERLSVPDA